MKSQAESKADSRQARSEATRLALMDAAEKLIAGKGVENVSIRDIVRTAGQKNESALQYHFGNLSGLISTLRRRRNMEVHELRMTLIAQTLSRTGTPTLREVCELMVAPPFELARSSAGFRRHIKAFGHEITLADASALDIANRTGGDSTQKLGQLLRDALPHLDESAYRQRMDGALRFVSAAMVNQARQRNAFSGPEGRVFYSGLIDALVGLLNAPESAETSALRHLAEG